MLEPMTPNPIQPMLVLPGAISATVMCGPPLVTKDVLAAAIFRSG